MTEYGLTTRSYLIGLVLQNLDDKVEFFQDSKLEPDDTLGQVLNPDDEQRIVRTSSGISR